MKSMNKNTSQFVEVTKVVFAKETPQEREETIKRLKERLKVGLKVQVENGRNEIVVAAEIVAITDDTFTVKHGVRQTICKFESAWYVEPQGRQKLILGDNDHCYAHVV